MIYLGKFVSDKGAVLETEYRFHDKRRWRFDYAIPKWRIAIEIEGGMWLGRKNWTGGRHNRPVGQIKDMEKYNMAIILGWRLLRYPNEDEAIITRDIELILETEKLITEKWVANERLSQT